VSFVNHHGSAPVFLLNPFHPCLSARQRRLRPAGSSARAAALPCHDDLRAGWGWGCGAGGGSGGSKSGRRASARARRPSTGPTTRSAASRRRSVARAAAGISSSEPVAGRRRAGGRYCCCGRGPLGWIIAAWVVLAVAQQKGGRRGCGDSPTKQFMFRCHGMAGCRQLVRGLWSRIPEGAWPCH
jgi:hypothetical protein